jgi:hypothetical protein
VTVAPFTPAEEARREAWPRDRLLEVGIWAVVGGVIAIYVLVFTVSALGRLVHPIDEFVYGESWLLDGARQVARGGGLYAPADQIPLMHIAYTPLYYMLVGGLARVLGDAGYTTGRVVSLLAVLVGAAALAFSLRRLTSRWSVGGLGAGLFLTQNLTVLLWAPLHRVDALALGLTLVGIALATAGRVSLAAILFLLALSTKQTYLVAPIALLCVTWPCKTSVARVAAIVIGGALLGVGLGQWLTGGWFLWHTVVANNNEPDLSTFSILMGSFMQFNGLTVLAALTSLTLPARPGERLWRLYFVIGLVLLVATIAKLGASSNYWLEVTAATSALLALASYRMAAWPRARLIAPTVLSGSLLIAVPGYQAVAVDAVNSLAEALRPPEPRFVSLVADTGAAPYRVEARFIEAIAREPGELLTDNSGLAVAAGKRIEYEFQIFQLLYVEGRWSQEPILGAIAQRRFSLVALMHPLEGSADGTRWTPAVHDALVRAYAPSGSAAGFWLYRPRPD